ncbi:hypothetical protein HPB52_023932 [Rhipicephalus sanguineus]|uniref:DUF4371 domain-containing protein n=1 Tax=Rhipicephalus sanguineus TaxID=34632 RepID=A0A9D4QA15_RHISA|nr:hypothetical protein HPB52_023932 [Rhipicephalus sanguineus]
MATNAETPLMDALKQQVFSIAVDGSNNRDTQLYPIVATYFVKETSRVESRLLCLGTIKGEATGQKIGHLILDALRSRNLPAQNLLAMSSDNANVMVGKKNSMSTVLKEAQPALIGVGCPDPDDDQPDDDWTCSDVYQAVHKIAGQEVENDFELFALADAAAPVVAPTTDVEIIDTVGGPDEGKEPCEMPTMMHTWEVFDLAVELKRTDWRQIMLNGQVVPGLTLEPNPQTSPPPPLLSSGRPSSSSSGSLVGSHQQLLDSLLNGSALSPRTSSRGSPMLDSLVNGSSILGPRVPILAAGSGLGQSP